MSSSPQYRFLNHIDAPKRYLSLTTDELVVAVIAVVLLIGSTHRVLVSLFGLGLLTLLRGLKKGGSPKRLLLLAYWYLPCKVTAWFLPRLPKSHLRIWKA